VSSVTTGEIAAVVTATVHQLDDRPFIEVPLFATAAGYKRLGIARLFNAALQDHCIDNGCSFIVISAEPNAVAFWMTPSLGYSRPTGTFKKRIDAMYKLECSQFEGSELLVWFVDEHVAFTSLVQGALDRSTKLLLQGPTKLPVP
jgi:hypothetical protein